MDPLSLSSFLGLFTEWLTLWFQLWPNVLHLSGDWVAPVEARDTQMLAALLDDLCRTTQARSHDDVGGDSDGQPFA